MSDHLRAGGAAFTAVLLWVPLPVALSRNRARGPARAVPEGVIERMAAEFELPRGEGGGWEVSRGGVIDACGDLCVRQGLNRGCANGCVFACHHHSGGVRLLRRRSADVCDAVVAAACERAWVPEAPGGGAAAASTVRTVLSSACSHCTSAEFVLRLPSASPLARRRKRM